MSSANKGRHFPQSIYLNQCDKVTDAGVSVLGAGCSELRGIDLRGCDKVTDAGISALDGANIHR